MSVHLRPSIVETKFIIINKNFIDDTIYIKNKEEMIE